VQDSVYTARFPGPRFIVRNVAETIELRVYRDGALVTPSAVTVSVYDANKTAVVDAESATVSASVASYTIPAATTANLDLGQGWSIKWTATVGLSNYQDYIDEAWVEITNRIVNSGRRPNLVLSPYSFRECHLYLTLALIFEDLSTRLNEAYELRAQQYREQYRSAWKEVKALMDDDEDGFADDPHHRTAADPTVWLGGRGGTRWLP
jgi:hypothetical protein